jgi:3-oxoacyl-[acyl-carrier protein] reductase
VELLLAGRTALVTGASKRRLAACRYALGAEGAPRHHRRRRDRLGEVAAEIVARAGIGPVIIEQDFMATMRRGDRGGGARGARLGADLVNNAGGSRAFKLQATEAQWEEALTLNFTRQRQLTDRLLAPMIDGRWGRIVNITGKSEPEGVNGAFCAKAAMHSWAKGLSREVGRHGITVNSIPPGRILSEQILRNYAPEYRAWQSEHEIPVGEYGQPEDIAYLVCFLCSPLARYVSGTVIPVDGGLRKYQF